MNSGTMKISFGSIREQINTIYSAFFPLNCSLEKEYAARDENTITSTVDTVDTRILLKAHRNAGCPTNRSR